MRQGISGLKTLMLFALLVGGGAGCEPQTKTEIMMRLQKDLDKCLQQWPGQSKYAQALFEQCADSAWESARRAYAKVRAPTLEAPASGDALRPRPNPDMRMIPGMAARVERIMIQQIFDRDSIQCTAPDTHQDSVTVGPMTAQDMKDCLGRISQDRQDRLAGRRTQVERINDLTKELMPRPRDQ
jgi:hypothetical protein